MRLHRFSIKIFDDAETTVTPGEIIPVFHDWIQSRAFDELLIDVGDYKHVPGGPGAILVGLRSDYSYNDADGGWGLTYTRKRDLETEAEESLESAIGLLASAASRLQEEPELHGRIRFDPRRFVITFLDRLAVPNSDIGSALVAPVVESIFDRAGCRDVIIAPTADGDPRAPLQLTVRVADDVSLETLSGRTVENVTDEVAS